MTVGLREITVEISVLESLADIRTLYLVVAQLERNALHFLCATAIFRYDMDVLFSQQSGESMPVAGVAQSLDSRNSNLRFRPFKTVKFLQVGCLLLRQCETVTLSQSLTDLLILVAVASRFHAFAVVADHIEHDMTVRFVGLIVAHDEKLRLVQPHHLDIVKSDFKHFLVAEFRLVVGGKR